MRAAALLVGSAVAAGCLRAPAYQCATDDECTAAGDTRGFCEAAPDGNRYCAYLSSTCGSKVAFGAQAGALEGTCAGGALPAGRGGDVCLPGARLPATYSACAARVCARLPTCCTTSWSPLCVQEVGDACDLPCGSMIALAGKGVVDVLTDDDDDGVFTVLTSLARATQPYASVAWADLDGDARPELVVGTADLNNAGDEQWIDHFDGAAIVDDVDLRKLTTPSNATPLERFDALTLSVGDYDGDGYADVGFLGTYPGFVAVHNAHGGLYGAGPDAPTAAQNPILGSGGWGDVDGDGHDELAVASDAAAWLYAFTGATPTAVWTVTLPGRAYWAGWGDLDGDGHLDLAIAGDGYARVYRNTGGALAKTPAWSSGDGGPFYGGAWIDVDRDGHLDLALAINDGPIELFLNSAGGLATTPAWTSLEPNEAPGVAVGDIDHDGDDDLIVANHALYPSRIYVNGGDRTFTARALMLPAGQAYESAAVTDRYVK